VKNSLTRVPPRLNIAINNACSNNRHANGKIKTGASGLRILLIEDEPRLVELLAVAMRRTGFVVDAVGTCADGQEALSLMPYDAAILDLGLPDGDGLELLAGTRFGGNSVPILILTARDAVEDRVCGLDRGADDYLVKPFATEELIARVKALLRRPGGALGTVLHAGNVTFDTVGRDVKVDGNVIAPPRREIAILEHLMRRVGRVVPKALLEEKLYGIDDELESNAIPVHIHHLRRKLLEAGSTAEIHTVRGVGYLLCENKT
jgi:DNA-binding response OmpR family regulator